MGKLRMGAALIYVNGQTDRRTVGQTGGLMNMTTLTGAFRESANAPKNHNVWCGIQSLTCGKRRI